MFVVNNITKRIYYLAILKDFRTYINLKTHIYEKLTETM